MITQEYIKNLLHYDPETGVFTWLPRTPSMFKKGKKQTEEWKCKIWNSKYAGKITGDKNKKKEYQAIVIFSKVYCAHIIAWIYMYGEKPTKDLDHIDGNKSNNAIKNLRQATESQNGANSRKSKRNSSGFKGVSYHKATKKYASRIQVNRKSISLGYFDSAKEAHKAYCLAAKEYFGEYACFE